MRVSVSALEDCLTSQHQYRNVRTFSVNTNTFYFFCSGSCCFGDCGFCRLGSWRGASYPCSERELKQEAAALEETVSNRVGDLQQAKKPRPMVFQSGRRGTGRSHFLTFFRWFLSFFLKTKITRCAQKRSPAPKHTEDMITSLLKLLVTYSSVHICSAAYCSHGRLQNSPAVVLWFFFSNTIDLNLAQHPQVSWRREI